MEREGEGIHPKVKVSRIITVSHITKGVFTLQHKLN